MYLVIYTGRNIGCPKQITDTKRVLVSNIHLSIKEKKKTIFGLNTKLLRLDILNEISFEYMQ